LCAACRISTQQQGCKRSVAASRGADGRGAPLPLPVSAPTRPPGHPHGLRRGGKFLEARARASVSLPATTTEPPRGSVRVARRAEVLSIPQRPEPGGTDRAFAEAIANTATSHDENRRRTPSPEIPIMVPITCHVAPASRASTTEAWSSARAARRAASPWANWSSTARRCQVLAQSLTNGSRGYRDGAGSTSGVEEADPVVTGSRTVPPRSLRRVSTLGRPPVLDLPMTLALSSVCRNHFVPTSGSIEPSVQVTQPVTTFVGIGSIETCL
jgi:hypothetical protein